MREILFRGKSLKTGAWLVGNYEVIEFEGASAHFVVKKIFPALDRHHITKTVEDSQIIPETVGQYTGLTDKNGNRIFEGDIVYCDRHIAPSVDMQTFEIQYDRMDGFYGAGWSSSITMDQHELMEVVTNIHDRPDWDFK